MHLTLTDKSGTARNNHLQVGMRVEFRPKLNSIVKKGVVIQQDHIVTDGLKWSPLENQIYNTTRKKLTLWKREKYLPDSQETKDHNPIGENSLNANVSCQMSRAPGSPPSIKMQDAGRCFLNISQA